MDKKTNHQQGSLAGQLITLTLRTIRIFEPVAIAMMFTSLLAFQGFFGGEPGGAVGRDIFNYRWELALMALVGGVLYAAAQRVAANSDE